MGSGDRARLNADPHLVQRLKKTGGVLAGSGPNLRIVHPNGAQSPVSHSLGDRSWKGEKGGGVGPPILVNAPFVKSTALRGCEEHPFLLLTASSVAMALESRELIDMAREFRVQPRAA